MAKAERSTGIMALSALAVAFALTGCSSFGGDDDVVYCVDQNDRVVTQEEYEKYCDESSGHYVGHGGSYFFMHGPYASNISPGTQLDRGSSYGRFSTTDINARTNAGLPSSGKVTVGQPIPGKSGGFGFGGGGSKGGFGGGGSTGG